jgi:hypothetical protein
LLKHFGITKTVSVVVFLCVVAGVGLGIFSGLQKNYLLPLYWLFYLLLAAAAILQEAYVQKQVDQQGRSTVHSIISLVYNLYGLIFMLGIYAISGLGIHTILLLVSVYIIILSMLLWIRHAKLNK